MPAVDTPRRACGLRPGTRRRGLCGPCYERPAARALHESAVPRGGGLVAPPPAPTAVPPGPAKVAVPGERARLGVALWRPADAPLED